MMLFPVTRVELVMNGVSIATREGTRSDARDADR